MPEYPPVKIVPPKEAVPTGTEVQVKAVENAVTRSILLNPDESERNRLGKFILEERLTKAGLASAGVISVEKMSPQQRSVADGQLDVLAAGIYSAVFHNLKEPRVEPWLMALGGAAYSQVNALLPPALKGMEGKLVGILVKRPDLETRAREVDQARKATNMAVGSQREALAKVLDGAIAEVAGRKIRANPPDWEQFDRLTAYWENEAKRLRGLRVSSSGAAGVTSGADAMQRYYERQAAIGEMVEATSKEEWLQALIYKLPKTRPGALWEYDAPGWVLAKSADETERRSQWRRLIETVDGLHVGTINRRNSTEFNGGGIKGVAETVMNLPKISESDLRYLYENQRGFKESLETIMADLFDEKVADKGKRELRNVTPTDAGKTTFFVFKELKRGNVETRAGVFVRDFGEYKEDLAKRLSEDRGLRLDPEQAKIMVSAATDFLEQGGVFEFADTDRKATFTSDGARTAMRPWEKFRLKLEKGERFGGNWSTYFRMMMGNVLDRMTATVMANPGLTEREKRQEIEREKEQEVVRRMKESGYIPLALSGSVLNKEMFENNKVSLGRLLKDKSPIRFTETSNDILYDTKKWIKAACDFWSCVAGGAALEFREFAEYDNVITKFVDPLANAMGDIEGYGIELSGEEVAGAIGGAAGMWPFEGPYIRIAKYAGNLAFVENYAGAGQEIVAQLGLSRENEKRVIKILGFNDEKRLKDLNDRCSKLELELNPNARSNKRERYRRERLHLV